MKSITCDVCGREISVFDIKAKTPKHGTFTMTVFKAPDCGIGVIDVCFPCQWRAMMGAISPEEDMGGDSNVH